MFHARHGIFDAILADTSVSAVIAGSTVGVIKLDAGEGANWQQDDLLYLTGSGATAGNDNLVRVVASVSTDDLTITPDLPVAPVAADQVKGGCREWLWYQSAADPGLWYYNPVKTPGPVDDLMDQISVKHECLAFYELIAAPGAVFDLREDLFRVTVVGRDQEFVEGFAQRVKRYFHHQVANLTLPDRTVFELVVGDPEDAPRLDTLRSATFSFRLTAEPTAA